MSASLPRRRWFRPAAAAVALLLMSGSALPGRTAEGGRTIRVMTFNLRGAADPPPRDWRTRLPLVERLLRRHEPDLLGVQEARWRQMRDLAAALPDYGWVGLGSQGGTRDQFLSVFYRRDRFELLDFDHFWLSSTPSVIGSSTWGNSYARMVTWAKLRDRRTGAVLYHLNTHLDNKSAYSRLRSAELILDRVRRLQRGIPVVLTGDFNSAAGASPAYTALTAPGAFRDTWTAASRHGPQYRTDAHWEPPVKDGERVDWILSRGAVRTDWAEIDPYPADGRYASDHDPVVAHLRIGAG
ncbi:endonuclease/exonuclease/phosphatase family protein [Actinomadura chibensis]|uniref:Endonuclease/exonuclease/phosphatase family protein n=1 Tax=Actinomadura chibensis TaxID=392828 RepID=A0A5D0ND62_9ACTN|nr:endonuclease/exonuclease/phosphatase family protein [Actinomadura chibensis]TYB42370.1 endonuclease/exonuclease/phosphatase family protein [Actinomadura chibensis]